MKDLGNIIIFGLMIIFVIFTFSIAGNVPLTPMTSYRRPRYTQATVQLGPILISPSNVRILQQNDRQSIHSPGTSYQNSETNIPINPRFSPPITQHIFTKNRSQFKSEGEMICCEVLEELVKGEVQVNIRPNFLKNPDTRRNLELDCYYEKKVGDKTIKIGLEYQGAQHYSFVKRFHKNGTEDLTKMKRRDEIKKELCAKAGIVLICIPYIVDCGEKDSKGNWKYVTRCKSARKELIKKFLEPLIYDILNS